MDLKVPKHCFLLVKLNSYYQNCLCQELSFGTVNEIWDSINQPNGNRMDKSPDQGKQSSDIHGLESFTCLNEYEVKI